MALVCALYGANLTGMGLVSADEPRYAEIGREMAAGGDLITPHLWGKPWFEKPALLYWMTAGGFRAGLGPDLAPRLPVALLSLGFLLFYWFWLRREWTAEIACCGTAILATAAGWLAYSHVAVTDLPMSVFFSAALMLAISSRPKWMASAACLAIAALAKGLVPIALFAPVVLFEGYKKRFTGAEFLKACAAFLAIALPWYVLCTLKNGAEFPEVFFVQQTFGRFNSDALQHAQPFWFYVPVALMLLYPWFPLLGVARAAIHDSRSRMLAATAIFGFIFFSAMKNKLPGYLLPLLPAVCALLAIGYVRQGRPRWTAAAVVALLGLLPAAAHIVPLALATGIRRAHPGSATIWWPVAAGVGLGFAVSFVASGRTRFSIAAAAAALLLIWFQFRVFPSIDRAASARPLWMASHPDCAPRLPRSLLYGLQYYAGRELPGCAGTQALLYGIERR